MVFITITINKEKFKLNLKNEKVFNFLEKELKGTYTELLYGNNDFLIIAYDLNLYENSKIKQILFKIELKTTDNIFNKIFEDIYIFNGRKNI